MTPSGQSDSVRCPWCTAMVLLGLDGDLVDHVMPYAPDHLCPVRGLSPLGRPLSSLRRIGSRRTSFTTRHRGSDVATATKRH